MTMSVLEKMRDLLTPGTEEDLPESEEIAAKRSEVREEIESLEDDLLRLRSDEGRREALREADGPEDLGRRKRLIEDRISGLEDLDSELVERQRAGKNREMQETLRAAAQDLPALADAYEEAMAAEREARSRLEEALSEVGEAHGRLYQRDLAPDVALPEAQVDRLERLSDHLSGHHGGALDSLRPEDEEETERRVVKDVENRVRRFVGDWSGVDPRSAVPPAPAGWSNDYSAAEGIEQ